MISLISLRIPWASAIQEGRNRIPALIELASSLPEPLREQALREALATALTLRVSIDAEAKVLTKLASYLAEFPIIQLYPFWCIAIRFLATQTRSTLLPILTALSPVVETLGGEDALIALAEATIEVGKWFP
jgi:hypothetical protein